ILAEQYGLTVAQAQQLAQQSQEPEFSDPLEQAIHEERQARLALEQRLQQREADEQLRGVITDLRSQFQLSDDDLNQVVQVAY
ncbi:hypothetical protein, partial [Enterococcus casseliflavus]|uniref:hypothetical protein n=1 Tax=Enterococcus casseliflavus TaxID=37734 RepID=UPI003D1398CB